MQVVWKLFFNVITIMRFFNSHFYQYLNFFNLGIGLVHHPTYFF